MDIGCFPTRADGLECHWAVFPNEALDVLQACSVGQAQLHDYSCWSSSTPSDAPPGYEPQFAVQRAAPADWAPARNLALSAGKLSRSSGRELAE